MRKRWLARKYVYANGVSYNEDRYEIFIWNNGDWVSVGGAIRKWGGKTIAFLCLPAQQRDIRKPDDVPQRSAGLYIWGETTKAALHTLKSSYPDPCSTLNNWISREMAAF